MPKLSIIIPIYNNHLTLQKCINSMLDVTPDFTYEIIVVDDGSTDQTPRILNNYKNIKVLSQPNSGVSSARNLGIKHATGEYIMFVDADDYLLPNWAKIIHEAIIANPCSDCIFFSQNSSDHQSTEKIIEHICGFNDNMHSSAVWSKLYRRNIIEKNSIKFDSDIINGEDILFNLESGSYNTKIKLYPKSFYVYNVNSSSATHLFNPNIIQSDTKFQKKLVEVLNSYNDKKYLYLSSLSIINAWITIFDRYSYNSPFLIKDLSQLLGNPLYQNELKAYTKYRSYFSKSQKIILWLLFHRQYRIAYTILRIKNLLKVNKDHVERI